MDSLPCISSENMYKAEPPEKTVERVKEIFYECNISLEERGWQHEENLFASLGLGFRSIPKVFSCGKGVNKEYAAASAYAEICERLQNLILLNGRFPKCNSSMSDLEFPDIKDIKFGEFKRDYPEILRNLTGESDFNQLEKLFTNNYHFRGYPYYNVRNSDIVYLPKALLRIFVGSNGMCAGNTPSEAIIQGLCEIFERYILKKLYSDEELKLPLIPDKILEKTSQWKYIEALRERGFEVYVKDCSLGGKVPTTGVLLIKGNKAMFSLGAAPSFTTAIERCITEMFQGLDFEAFESKMPLIASLTQYSGERDFSSKEKNREHNFFKTLRSGEGVVNPKVFNHDGEFKLENLYQCGNQFSKETMNMLISKLKSWNCDIFIRDVSFLGFPSFHVYIPGMSEMVSFNFEIMKTYLCDIPNVQHIFFNLRTARKEKIIKLARTLEKILENPYLDQSMVLESLHNLSLKNDAILLNTEPEIFLTMLFYRIGEIEKATALYKKYIKKRLTPDKFHNPPEYAKNHICLLRFFEHFTKYRTMEEALNEIKNEFEDDVVGELLPILKEPEKLDEYFDIPRCIDCKKCNHTDICYSKELGPINQIIQSKIDKYEFDQKKIKKLMSS